MDSACDFSTDGIVDDLWMEGHLDIEVRVGVDEALGR